MTTQPTQTPADRAGLGPLLDKLSSCAPSERIELRDSILEFGVGCVDPLCALARNQPALVGSVASWLEVLARRTPASQEVVRAALRRLATSPDGSIARQALDRLSGTVESSTSRAGGRKTKPKPRRDAGAEVHARVIAAAKAGRILTYSELETSRGHVGGYLRRIVQEEHDAGHPPLTAIVVSKTTGKPGDGFLPAMIEIGYAKPGDQMADVWRRAVDEVHRFWRAKSE